MLDSILNWMTSFPNWYAITGIHDDKTLHFFLSATICFVLFTISKESLSKKSWQSIAIISTLSVVKELYDHFTPGRNVEFFDVFSNFLGLAFAFFSYRTFFGDKKFSNSALAIFTLSAFVFFTSDFALGNGFLENLR